MSATRVDVPRAYAYVSSPHRALNGGGPSSTTPKTSFDMSSLANSLNGLKGKMDAPNNEDPTTVAFNEFEGVMDNAVNEFYRENTRGEVRYHRTGNNIGVVHIPISPGKSLEKQD
jgi:hypothetical protein